MNDEASAEFSVFQIQPSGTTGYAGVYFDGHLFETNDYSFQVVTRNSEQATTARIFIQSPDLYQDQNVLKVHFLFYQEM